MDKQFCLGIILGMLGGAVLVTNVPKVKKAVEKSQKTVLKKIKELCKGKSHDYEDEDYETEQISDEE